MLVITEYKGNDTCSNTQFSFPESIAHFFPLASKATQPEFEIRRFTGCWLQQFVMACCCALIATGYAWCLLQLGNLA